VHDVWVFRAAASPNLRCPERKSRRGLQRSFQLLRPFCDVKRMTPVDIRAPPVSYFVLQWRCHSSAVEPCGRRSRYLHWKTDPFARIALVGNSLAGTSRSAKEPAWDPESRILKVFSRWILSHRLGPMALRRFWKPAFTRYLRTLGYRGNRAHRHGP